MEASSESRHRVLDARRYLGVEDTVDESVAFEIAKLLGEHPLADPRDQPAKLGEAERPLRDQGVDDGRLPLAGDDAHDQLNPLYRVRARSALCFSQGIILYQVMNLCLLDFVYWIT